jgi:aminoglycoside phosphotransferase (APT) family kinase protein
VSGTREQKRQRLRDYLALRWSDPGLTVPEFSELSDGWSRVTYALTVERRGTPLKLIVQVERKSGVVIGSSVARDHAILRALEGSAVPAPATHLQESDPAILGGPFIVVERKEGDCFDMFNRRDRELLEKHWKRGSALPSSVVEVIVAVHGIPVDRVPFLSSAPGPEETAAWEIERCRGIARQIGREGDPFVATAMRWLERNKPPGGSLALVHGDYHLRNILISGERVVGLLDWELTRVSDPLFDVAYMCIPYLSGKFFSPGSPLALGLVPLDWLVKEYERRRGREIEPGTFRFWRVLATLSLLLIIDTGVSAFETGAVCDVRSAWLRFVEPVLHEDLLELLGRPRSPRTMGAPAARTLVRHETPA